MNTRPTPRNQPALLALIALLLLTAGCGESAESPAPPHVLLITVDTTRADVLAVGGATEPLAPHLDALARESIACTDARATAPLTLPSHTSMLTGLYPFAHGIRGNDAYRLHDDTVTVARLLTGAGYRTEAVVAVTVLKPETGLGLGFERYDAPPSQRIRNRMAKGERRAEEVTDLALERLRADDERPWFLWVHYFDPHRPYDAPGAADVTDDRAAYGAEVTYMDRHVGRLLDELRSRGLMDRTMVLVVGDHGEGLSLQREETHGLLLEEGTLQIPLLVRAPGGEPRGRLEVPTSCVDAFATILAAANVAAPGRVHGRDLIQRFQEPSDDDADRAVYFETHHAHQGFGWAPLSGVAAGNFKYVRGVHDELRRLEGVHGESADPTGPDSRALTAMRLRLEQLIEEPVLQFEAEEAFLAPEEQEQLAELGYLASRQDAPTDTSDLLDPRDHYEAWRDYRRAQGLADEGRLAEALPLLRELVQKYPGTTEFENYLGRSCLAARQLDEGLRLLEQSVARDPTRVSSHYYLGRAYEVAGRADDALREYDAALVLFPGHLDARLQRSLIHQSRGNAGPALVDVVALLGPCRVVDDESTRRLIERILEKRIPLLLRKLPSGNERESWLAQAREQLADLSSEDRQAVEELLNAAD